MAAGALNQKVPWAAGGAAGGSLVGNAVADLLTTFLTSGMGWTLTETNIASINIITVMLMSAIGSFATGYIKGSGLSIEEQTADLKVAKAVQKAESKK